MGFPRQEYWSGLPFPSPGDVSNLGVKPIDSGLLHSQVDSLPLSPQGRPDPIDTLLKLKVVQTPRSDFQIKTAMTWKSPAQDFTGGPVAKTLSS